MARRRIIFINLTTGQELILPVTPERYQIDRGIDVQTVNLTGFGDVHLAGDRKLFTETLSFLLPVHDYAFNDPTTVLDPFHYIWFFQLASDNKQVCRFIVSDTPTQCEVLFENLQYREQDGTNDYYCELTLRRYRQPNPIRLVGDDAGGTSAVETSQSRASSAPTETEVQSYTIQSGDTLSGICRKFYGDAALYPKLAAYNGIANANLIYDGHTLNIPPASAL